MLCSYGEEASQRVGVRWADEKLGIAQVSCPGRHGDPLDWAGKSSRKSASLDLVAHCAGHEIHKRENNIIPESHDKISMEYTPCEPVPSDRSDTLFYFELLPRPFFRSCIMRCRRLLAYHAIAGCLNTPTLLLMTLARLFCLWSKYPAP